MYLNSLNQLRGSLGLPWVIITPAVVDRRNMLPFHIRRRIWETTGNQIKKENTGVQLQYRRTKKRAH